MAKLILPDIAGTRFWVDLNGNIRPTETHSVAYDFLSKIVFGGNQDVGNSMQSAQGNFTWNEFGQGDGAVVAVDTDQGLHQGTSIRYTSSQHFGNFIRTSWDATNTQVGGFVFVGLNITSGPGTGQTLQAFDPPGFYQPFALNAITPSRMLIATSTIYESMNQGDSLANLNVSGGIANALAYGSRLNGVDQPDVFYVGTNSEIWHRVIVGGPITSLSLPGSAVRALAVNPENYKNLVVVDSQSRV
jgi:hypothetical protein